METLNATIFSMWNLLKETNTDVTVAKTVIVAITTLVLAVVVKKVANFCVWYIYYIKLMRQVPGPENTHWLYGNLHLLTNKHAEQLKLGNELTAKFPRMYKFWIGPFNATIVLNHPETIKQVLKYADPKSKGFGGAYRHVYPWLGEGLLLADGQRWSRARRLLTPAFHFNILKPYITIYNKATDQLLQKFERYAEEGKSFDLLQEMSLCTLDILLQCIFSMETDCQQRESDYVKSVLKLGEIWSKRNRSLWLFPDVIFYNTRWGREFKEHCAKVHKMAESIIKERQNEIDQLDGMSERPYLDFLDLLLQAKDEDGNKLTESEIRNEVDTFLFEGHDTTASSTSWLLHLLAQHQNHQQRVQQELDTIWHSKSTEYVQWNDLPNFEYLTMCLKESLRASSTVSIIQRLIPREITIDDKILPPNTLFTIAINSVHHNPAVWKNPSEYLPERFSHENSTNIDNFSYIPFSAGPRNCIGQHFALNEEKVILSRILRRFTVELDPNFTVEKKIGPVLKAENGIRVFVTRRNVSK
ncbi:cytochrome P450 4F2-like isoform X2 [Ostrea edulis]|uniref:cytochrome P450 4F2-like isoform X2 n=1 Tax=Ostrea edulis TaxID=37623 RepID=UPI0020947CC6|nr:cytochrome P450 4F2-like isoform X2 [Ostrea edulis]XP_056020583.1 cytochrome P450 4F2-like isoform X2 [Ostrea edulis]